MNRRFHLGSAEDDDGKDVAEKSQEANYVE
jgi:hypothetical protein